MSWTTSGTVSVTNNSKKVYGAGTPWVSNGKTRPGDEIIMPNGARHEVESVQSNTELTLVAPYMGVTAGGQTYALLHIGLLPAELAVKLSDLQSKYLTTIAQLYEWETSVADTVPITNPATGVTMQVKPLARFLAALGDGSMAGSFTTLSASVAVDLLADGPARINWRNVDSYLNWIECDGVPNNNYMRFGVGNTEMLRLTTGLGVLITEDLSVTGALTTNSIKEDTAGNVGVGVTPGAWSTGKALQINSVDTALWGAGSSTYLLRGAYYNGGYKYTSSGVPARYIALDDSGVSWSSAPAGTTGDPIAFVQDMALVGGNLLVGATSGSCHTLRKSADDLVLSVENASASTPYGQRIHFSAAAPNNTATYFLLCSDNSASRAQILANGNVQNQNNSYGAISDIKHKERITDTSPKLDKLMLVRIVDYFLKADPTHKLLGVIAQELELIFPGMIEETPDYEDVEVSPAHIEQKITQRQKVEYREDVRYEITEVDGKWTKLPIRTTVEVPLFEEFPLFDETGAAVMECVEAAQVEVVGEDGEIVTPAKEAVWKKTTHRVPVMEDVTETVDVPAVIERRATGEVTKSVKYSVFVPMLIKAMQEQQTVIEGLEARITTLEAA